jgi:hypothetical protein
MMVIFSIIFISGVVAALLTLIDGGSYQGAQLGRVQSNRIAAGGALQAAISQMYKGKLPGTNGFPTCPAGLGSAPQQVVTYTDPVSGTVTVTCQVTQLANGSTSGSPRLDLGADALILTDTTDPYASLSLNNGPSDGWGWLAFSGNVRLKGGTNSVQVNARGGKVCNPYNPIPTDCSQIVFGNGALWADKGLCSTGSGVYAASLSCNMGGTEAGIIDSILAKASTELPFPMAAVVDQSGGANTTCTSANAQTNTPAEMILAPGYYGGPSGTAFLNDVTSSKYYVKTTGGVHSCALVTSAPNGQHPTPITTVILAPGSTASNGNYFFGLNATWTVANGVTLVGGTQYLVTDPSSTTAYVDCNATSSGVQLIFGAIAANSNVHGLNSAGVVTLCGLSNSGAGLNGPSKVVLRGVTSADTDSVDSSGNGYRAVAGQRLYPDATCQPSVSTCALLTNTTGSTNSPGGAFNIVSGFTYAPNDSIYVYLAPACGGTSRWSYLNCEAGPRTQTYRVGTGGVVSFNAGMVLDGIYATIPGNDQVSGLDASGTWGGVPWIPLVNLPSCGSGTTVHFVASGSSSVAGAFSSASDAQISQFGSDIACNPDSTLLDLIVTNWTN